MERDLEVRAHMLQGEVRVTPLGTGCLHADHRTLRRLQWAVSGCAVGFCLLLALIIYQMSTGNHYPQQIQGESQSQVRSGIMASNTDDNKPIAHLTGKPLPADFKSNNILYWETTHGLAFVKGGMQSDNISIQIPKEGYYYIYAQVSLKSTRPLNQFESHIMKINDNYPDPETLLSGKAQKGDPLLHINFGGLLHLIRGDKLKVNVTSVSDVDFTYNHKTFFGAFCIHPLY